MNTLDGKCPHGRTLASRRDNPCPPGLADCSTRLGDTLSLLRQYDYTCELHGLDPCPVCDGCEELGHRPGTTVCLDCPGEAP